MLVCLFVLLMPLQKIAENIPNWAITNGGPNAQVPPRLLLPLIVTNAKIHTARYKPPDVSLERGEFIDPPKEMEKAPWVRFSKSFTADRGRDVGYRSIFVVNAIQLEEFLTHLELAPDQQQPSSV
jgi:hypothetical protein